MKIAKKSVQQKQKIGFIEIWNLELYFCQVHWNASCLLHPGMIAFS